MHPRHHEASMILQIKTNIATSQSYSTSKTPLNSSGLNKAYHGIYKSYMPKLNGYFDFLSLNVEVLSLQYAK